MRNTVATERRRMAGAVASSVALHALLLWMPFASFLHQGSNATPGHPGESGSAFARTFGAGALRGLDVVVLTPRVEALQSAPEETLENEKEPVAEEEVEPIESEMTRDLESAGGLAGSINWSRTSRTICICEASTTK